MNTALVFVLLFGSCLAASIPSFRYAYDEPTGQVAQFYSGPDTAYIYNWGYQYPGQSRTESKTYDGTVQGEFSFVDANGELQQAFYKASPGVGYTVSQEPQGPIRDVVQAFRTGFQAAPPSVVPQVSAVVPEVPGVVPQEPVVPEVIPYSYQEAQEAFGIPLDVKTERAIAEASPLVLRAIREGKLVPVLGYKDELVFRVGDELVEGSQGSVSDLAYALDVDTVAPRRDQKIPQRPTPSFYSAGTATADKGTPVRGVLDTDFFTDGPAYIVRIPLQ